MDADGRAELVETCGHALVLGELPGPAGGPRLLRYGMYDVQPADEPGRPALFQIELCPVEVVLTRVL